MIRLYPGFETAFFEERENRFVMRLKKEDGTILRAYVANPGRMEEFQVPGHPFYMTTGNQGKYSCRVVSTRYQDSYVLLDTIKINAVVEQLLKEKRIEPFRDIKNLRREVTVNRSRFDFLLEREHRPPILLEIKSCSLCHNGTAMFPDAPTTRGKRHLEDLETLATQGYETYNLYLINHAGARVFRPNGHTDPDYCSAFCRSANVKFLAYRVGMADPVTLDPGTLHPVPIDFEGTPELCGDKGSYLLIFHNPRAFTAPIGSLGERTFEPGYYVYVGSAMRGLEKRIKRHLRKNKTTHWHLDYISPRYMKPDRVYPIHRVERIESAMAQRLGQISDSLVPGFGSSDTQADSHLFYFSRRPDRHRGFVDLLLDFRHASPVQ